MNTKEKIDLLDGLTDWVGSESKTSKSKKVLELINQLREELDSEGLQDDDSMQVLSGLDRANRVLTMAERLHLSRLNSEALGLRQQARVLKASGGTISKSMLNRHEAICPGVSIHDHTYWDYYVTDYHKIPSQFTCLLQPAVRTHFDVFKGTKPIPGIREYKVNGT